MGDVKRISNILGTLMITTIGAGCVYHPPIQQGNILEERMLAQLTPGMSPQQVLYVMGTPLINDPFTANRWDYLYYKQTKESTERRLVTVYFENNLVSRIDKGELVKQADGS